MGIRNRNGEKKLALKLKTDLASAEKKFTRAKAERELSKEGVNPNDPRFLEHPNYHVRARAWVLMGRPLPDNQAELEKVLKDLRVKNHAKVGEAESPV